jgi:hypothetical protein
MRALLLLAALASPPSPSQPSSVPPQTVQDVRKDAPTAVPGNKNIYDNRIQVRPGAKKPGSEGRAGPGIG